MYYNNTEWLFKHIFPGLEWSVKTPEKVLYLTFDDGPIPEVTPFVLDTLNQFSAKATFFCVGDNARKNPDLLKMEIAQGHAVGNHTFNHLNGWKSKNKTYFENIEKCKNELDVYFSDKAFPKLFRPPYGKVKWSQIRYLKQVYRIIMWSVLTGDFDKKLSPENCLKNALSYSTSGSIVVFHDSLKAEKNLRYVLPRYLDYFTAKGYAFKAL